MLLLLINTVYSLNIASSQVNSCEEFSLFTIHCLIAELTSKIHKGYIIKDFALIDRTLRKIVLNIKMCLKNNRF